MLSRVAASRAVQKRIPLWVRSSSSTHHRTADPALHSGDTQGQGSDPNDEVGKIIEESQDEQQAAGVEGIIPPKKQPTQHFDKGEEDHRRLHQSSSSNFTVKHKLDSHPVNIPIDPNIQQKRRHNFQSTTAARSPELENVSCVGFDGTPLPMDDNEEEQRNNQDDKEYFKNRKPSALSEIEMADTRKPISRASDGTVDSFDTIREIEKTGWRQEQIDTAEEALRRAAMIWKEAAMRGDPDAPHSRALRTLLAERSR